MKRKIKMVILVIMVMVTIFYIKSYKEDMVIATVNGEPVYQSDCDRISELGTDLTTDEIMELVMKELLVYQEAEILGLVVEDDIVESRILSLKEEMPDLYSLCVEQYGSEEAYKNALSYTMLYNMVCDYYADQYISNLEYDIDDIKEEVIQCNYASEMGMKADEEKVIALYLKEKYRDEIRNYFEQWNNDRFEKAEITYKN